MNVKLHHLGSWIMASSMEHPPKRRKSDGADKDDAIKIHGLDGRGYLIGYDIEVSSVNCVR